jgi:hypothetical protein
MGITNFIPGWKTVEGVVKGAGHALKGVGKVLTLDFKGAAAEFGGAIKAVGKGLTDDWGLAIVSMAIPGLNALGAARLASLGLNAAKVARASQLIKPVAWAQLGAVGADFLGVFGRDGEGQGRQADATQYAQNQYAQAPQAPIQGPNIGW